MRKFTAFVVAVIMVFSSSVPILANSNGNGVSGGTEIVHGTGYVLPDMVFPQQPTRVIPHNIIAPQWPAGVNWQNRSATLNAVNQRHHVRDQGQTGLCWAFAAMSAIESATRTSPATTIDLSEAHAAYALSTAGGNTDFGIPSRPDPNDGGNMWMITQYAMRNAFNGFVRQGDDIQISLSPRQPLPLTRPGGVTDGEIPRSYIVPGAYLIHPPAPNSNSLTPRDEDRASRDLIKYAVVEFGSVTSTMFGDNINAVGNYWNAANFAYHQPRNSPTGLDHAVLIVGWDDTFPASNFTIPPPGPGAWLVMNSWGENWGLGGFLWISYYDKYAGFDSWVFEPARVMTDADRDNIIHDYNTTDSGWRALGFNNITNYGTNVFIAGTEAERLLEVRVFVSVAPHTYRIFFTDEFTGSIQISDPIATLNAEFVGYHTIAIPSQPIIQAGTSFAITVEYTPTAGLAQVFVPLSSGTRAIGTGVPLSGRSFVGNSTFPLQIDMATQANPGAPHIKAVTSPVTTTPIFAVNITGTAEAQTVLNPLSPIEANQMVTVTVTAPDGQRFTGAEGTTIPVTATGVAGFNLIVSADQLTAVGTFTMPANEVDLVVNADFEPVPPIHHNITVNIQGGEGTAHANPNFATQGTTITLTATAGTGYEFAEWQVVSGEVTLSTTTDNPTTFTMPDSDVEIWAVFEEIAPAYHNITVDPQGNGTAHADPNFAPQNTTITLTATPGTGYEFAEWQVVSGEVSLSTTTGSNLATFTMPDSDVVILAVFEEIGYSPYVTIITENPLPPATQYQFYSIQLVASGPSPITWFVTAENGSTSPPALETMQSGLPDGLTLDQETGVISGIPTTIGKYTFVVTALNLDYELSDSKDFSITITEGERLGDINGNGSITPFDATLVARYLVQHDITPFLAEGQSLDDARAAMKVTRGSIEYGSPRIIDATAIALYLIGQIQSLPCPDR